MAIQKNLDALRFGQIAVESVVFMDLASGTVLAASTAIDQPQELFDSLAATATDALGGGGGDADEAVIVRENEALVFRRSRSVPNEALTLVCAPDADVLAILDAAAAALGASGD